jgi:hypothetical protein
MKRGVKRLAPWPDYQPGNAAREGMAKLQHARDWFRAAGSAHMVAKISALMDSARGAVRAADMRERRLARETAARREHREVQP